MATKSNKKKHKNTNATCIIGIEHTRRHNKNRERRSQNCKKRWSLREIQKTEIQRDENMKIPLL